METITFLRNVDAYLTSHIKFHCITIIFTAVRTLHLAFWGGACLPEDGGDAG
jgi:hypothetical protein